MLKMTVFCAVGKEVIHLVGCFFHQLFFSLKLHGLKRPSVSESRELRKTFGPKRDDVAGEWRRLHNEELHDLYSSPNIILINSNV